MAQENVVVEAVSDVHNGGSENKKIRLSGDFPRYVILTHKISQAIKFYKSAFGAEELNLEVDPKLFDDGTLNILSAELLLGYTVIAIIRVPALYKPDGPRSICYSLLTNVVDGLDSVVANAVKAGAELCSEIKESGGCRSAKIQDPHADDCFWRIKGPLKDDDSVFKKDVQSNRWFRKREKFDDIPVSVGFSALKPHLIIQTAEIADAVQFYKSAFGAEELNRKIHGKRKADQELPLIHSAELKLASSIIVISNQIDDSAAPVKSDGTFCLVTTDVLGAVVNAVKAGAKIEVEVSTMEYKRCGSYCDQDGSARVAKVRDPYGFVWRIQEEADLEAKEPSDSG